MPEDDKRAADTLEEIRDLLVEMRDAEEARTVDYRNHVEESQRLQQSLFKRQKVMLLLLLAPVLLYLFWAVFREM